MRRHVSQVLLNLLHFSQTESRLVGLVVHFEVLYLLELLLGSPTDTLVAFVFLAQGLLPLINHLHHLVYSLGRSCSTLAERL